MKKSEAIKKARANVTQLSPIGGRYIYLVYRPDSDAYTQSIPRDYWGARTARAQALCDYVTELLDIDYVIYTGGCWVETL